MELRGRRLQRTGLGRAGRVAGGLLVVVAAVAYLVLAPPLTRGRDVVAVLAAVGAAALVHALRSPWWWLVPLVAAAGGGLVLAVLVSTSYAVTAWVLPAALGALTGAVVWLSRPDPPSQRRPPPDVHDEATLRAWAVPYGVPVALLEPDDEGRSAYAIERRGDRWRAVGPAHPVGRWRRTPELAYRDLYADLAYRYR